MELGTRLLQAGLGAYLMAENINSRVQISQDMNSKNQVSIHISDGQKQRLLIVLWIFFAGATVLILSHSIYISLSISGFVAILLTFARSKSNSKRMSQIEESSPELIDILISGAQAGLSLNESLCSLAERGPEILKGYFLDYQSELLAHGEFESALRKIRDSIANPSIDLIIEALQLSRTLGGAELINILRLLGNYIREDLSLRREIAVKHNWIRNSAHLSAAAPWILLLLLSTQPSTAIAFSTPTGLLILGAGLGMTATAYLWMNHLSKLPVPARIFLSSPEVSP